MVYNVCMVTIKVFIGTALSKNKGTYSMVAFNEGDFLQLPSVSIKKINLSKTELYLIAIRDFLKKLNDKKIKIIYCLNDHQFKQEFDNGLKNRKGKKGIWSEIFTFVDAGQKIEVQESLNGINRIESKKAWKQRT